MRYASTRSAESSGSASQEATFSLRPYFLSVSQEPVRRTRAPFATPGIAPTATHAFPAPPRDPDAPDSTARRKTVKEASCGHEGAEISPKQPETPTINAAPHCRLEHDAPHAADEGLALLCARRSRS